VTREIAGLVRDLQRRPAMYQRLATACAARLHRSAPQYLPRWLKTESVELKRLEACHRLIALGPVTLPAAPQLAPALSMEDPTTSFYAFLVLAHSTTPAPTVVALARAARSSEFDPVFLYAGLLGTEDELIRDFAWQCLESAGRDALRVVSQLRAFSREGEPAVRQRAEALLRRLGFDSQPERSSVVNP
jgi:hypothetical protein